MIARVRVPNISIPQWSDFNITIANDYHITGGISIPQWSDFNVINDVTTIILPSFQSHNGLILIITQIASDKANNSIISIPQWSDFNWLVPQLQKSIKRISIPQWSDFN